MKNIYFSEKSTSETGVKLLVFFAFFITFFYQNINQEHNLLSDCACGMSTYVFCENCVSGFSVFVLNLSLAIFCLDQLTEIVFPDQHQLSLVRR